MPKYGNALTQAVIDIIRDFYGKETNNLNVYQVGVNQSGVIINYDAMNEVLYHIKSTNLTIRLEDHMNIKKINKKRVHNVIFIDSYESFLFFFQNISPHQFEFQGYYLIVLTTYSYEQYTIMSNIFAYLWREYIINVNIIWKTPENDNEALLYTYFPFTPFYCGKSYPVEYNQYTFGKWLKKHERFFHSKLDNLHRCELSAAIVLTGPFMKILKADNGTIMPDGIDGVLLRVLSQRMNFTLKIVVCDDQGEIFENGTYNGAAKLVIDRVVNLTLGYTSMTPHRNYYMTSSYIYYTSNLIWMVPPGKLFSAIEKLGKPFEVLMWTFVMITFLIGFGIVFALKFQNRAVQNFVFGRGISTPCLNIVNVFFGGSLHRMPTRNFARTLLAFFMFYCLIIRSSYQGALFKFMKSDFREAPVKNIEEMSKKNFKFYVIKSSLELVTELPNVMKNIKFIERDELPVIQKKLIDSDFKGALLSSEEHVAWLNAIVSPNKFYRYSEEVLSVFNLCIYMHRQSCLGRRINKNIVQLSSSGILDSWVRGFIDRSYLKLANDQQPTQLDNHKLHGAYKLLFYGLLSSAFVFILEIISARVKFLDRLMKYL